MNAKKFFGFVPQKNLLLLACLALISRTNPTYAQTELGLIGGVNFSTLRPDSAEHKPYGFSSDKGFKAGAVLDIGLNRFLSLRMEPMWLQKGAILEQQYPEPHAPAYKSRIRLDYAELPVMFKISPFKGPVKPYLLAGGEAGYLLRATGKDLLDKNAEPYDIKSDFKSFDYGVTYGGGIKLPFIGNSSFFIEGRHSIGLSNIGADNYLPGLKTRGVQVMAGITLPLFQQGASCECRTATVTFPENGSGVYKDEIRKVVVKDDQAFINFGVKGRVTSRGKKGSFTVNAVVRYYLTYKDENKNWASSANFAEKTIPVTVECPNGSEEFQEWWQIPINVGMAKSKTVKYELHAIARVPDCEYNPQRGYFPFDIKYKESGNPEEEPKGSKDAQQEFDYMRREGSDEWRTKDGGSQYGWDKDDNILPPKQKR